MQSKVHTIQPQSSGIPQPTDRAVRLPEVIQITGRSKTMIYDDVKAGRFPRGFLIGGRARAWSLRAVMNWLESRKEVGAQ